MTHRSFAAAAAELEAEPITFDISEGVSFSIARPLPGFPVAKLASVSDEMGPKAIAALLEFFEAVMEVEEFTRFRSECDRVRVPLETLLEIAGHVIAEGTGRPTEQRPGSSGNSSKSSHLSPVAASNAD